MTCPIGQHQMRRRIAMRRAAYKWATVEARLIDLHQSESALEAGRSTTMERAERQLPTFTRASQNVPTVAALPDTLPAPSTNGVSEVYQWLKSILGTTAA
jgi:hypothetical protein